MERKKSSSRKKKPARQPEPIVIKGSHSEDARRRAEELIDEYGWDYLRVKKKKTAAKKK